MKKKAMLILMSGVMLAFSSCGNLQTEALEETSTIEQKETESVDLQEVMQALCGGNMLTDSDGRSVPDTDYLPLPGFGALPQRSVFQVVWDTENGSYMAGTSSLVSTDLSEEALLLTAIQYFGVESQAGTMTGEELSSYVKGGELHDILTDRTDPDGVVESVIPIAGAVGASDANDVEHDLAAFRVKKNAKLTGIPMADRKCKPGEVIYLAAYLTPELSVTYKDCLYPCVVISDDGVTLTYLLSNEFRIQGAAGAPLLNDSGELVGIHIGSDGSERYGHSVLSIYEQLEKALSKK